ncbi:MAG: Hpt domain-containing protein, partial [Planctomycetota bacterium]
MSVQQHLDALIWAAAVDTAVDAAEATEIQTHARALVASGDLAVPDTLAARLDELVERATKAADGDSDAASTLRALLADIMVGAEGPDEADEHAEDAADDDLLALFVAAGTETLLELESAILTLDQVEDAGEASEVIASLKRDIHTLKGECGVLSLHTAQEVWHEVENLIETTLDGGHEMPTEALMAALDWNREHLALLAADSSAPAPPHESLIRKLKSPADEGGAVEAACEAPVEDEAEQDSTPVEFPQELLEDETVPEFVTEARQHLEDSEAALFELEEDPTSSDGIDRIFRAFHTIKGVAGFLNVTPVTDLAHVVETLLDRFRGSDATVEFSSAHADIVLESKDMMDRLFEALMGADGPPADGLKRLIAHVTQVAKDPAKATPLGSQMIQSTLANAGIKDEEQFKQMALEPEKATGRLGAILIAKGM